MMFYTCIYASIHSVLHLHSNRCFLYGVLNLYSSRCSVYGVLNLYSSRFHIML
ncbi:hypothetical protein Hanom_Chr10g00932811 [Helianthus anomalus]